METLTQHLRHNFLLRWVLANVVGWTIGLYAGALNPLCFIIAGLTACICVGAAQWTILRPRVGTDWIVATVLGGISGTFPVLFAGLLVFFGFAWVGGCSGLLFGGAVGLAQWLILKRCTSRAGWWVAANAGGGLLCGLLTLVSLIPGLPIGLMLGAAAYGYITGRTLLWLSAQPAPSLPQLT